MATQRQLQGQVQENFGNFVVGDAGDRKIDTAFAFGKHESDRCDSVFDSGIDSLKSSDFETISQNDIEESTLRFSQMQILPNDVDIPGPPGEQEFGLEKTRLCTQDDEGFTEQAESGASYFPSLYDHLFHQDEDGDTQLHIAIIQEAKGVVDQIIRSAHCTDFLNMQNGLKQTPLHLAVLTNQPDIVRKLMLAGVGVGDQDSNGNTPLHLACKAGLTQCLLQMTTPISYNEAADMHYSVTAVKLAMVKDMEILNFEGYNCLHLAGLQHHFDIVQFLLSAGVDLNAQDGKSGRTLLHHAVESNHQHMVKFLAQQKGIEIDKSTWVLGCTALQLAIGRGLQELAEQLIAYGADSSNIRYQESDDSFDSYDEQEEQMYDDFTIGGNLL